jgi:hypothetical protein
MNKIFSATGIALSLALAACAGSGAQQDIARQFWDAMKAQDITSAQSFAKTGSMSGVSANKSAVVETINLQDATTEGSKAVVPTQLIGSRDGKREQLSFNTVLEQEDGSWKVNFDETMSSMMGLPAQGTMGKPIGRGMGGTASP